jgi:Ca2+-binding RTX toxin-like protein
MRKTVMLLASVALAMVLTGGVAWALNVVNCPNRDDDVCVGTDGSDSLRGTDRADTMRAFDGNDTMRGRDGDDTMDADDDSDTVFGGPGIDRIYGGRGSDRLEGGIGNDILSGVNGNDIILGGDGDDTLRHGVTLYGGDGHDILRYGSTLYGGSGDDTIEFGVCCGVIYVDSGPGEDLIREGNSPSEIHAVDGERDVIRCMGAKETIYADDIDRLVEDYPGECDKVIIR